MTETWFGRYEIIETLGGGGYGTVYRMLDRVLEMERAVKVLHPGLGSDAQFVERFRREARLAVRLKHPHIVPVLDFGEAEGRYYLVMEYLPGGSLAKRLQTQGPFSLEAAADLVVQVASALDALHAQGLAHCDLKPDNVLFDAEEQAVLVDFGFARAAHSASSTTASISQGMFGTPGYMAPEQMDVNRAALVGPASDVYALGVMVFELLGGRKPFEGSTPALIGAHLLSPPPLLRSLRPELPEGVELLVQQALSKDPAVRPLPAGSFASRLAKLAHLELEAASATPTTGKAQAAPPLELETGELALEEKYAEGVLSPARRLRSGKTAATVWELLAALQADPDETLVLLYTGTLEAWLSPLLTPAAQALLAQIPQVEEDRKRGVQRFSDAFVPLLISDALNRGRLALGQGEWGKADAFASQALLVQPENKAAAHLRQQAAAGALRAARLAWRKGEISEARAAAGFVLDISEDPEAGFIHEQTCRVEEMVSAFQVNLESLETILAQECFEELLLICPQWNGLKQAQERLQAAAQKQQDGTVTLPKLGFDMTSGTLTRWIIGEGRPVTAGELLAEIETDKATVEVESPFSGVVLKHLVKQGDSVPVGARIAMIKTTGEAATTQARLPTSQRDARANDQPKGQQKPSQYKSQGNPAGIEWVEIPAGEFLYGDDKKKQRISEPFMIGKTPVTQAQYQKFIDANPNYPVPYIEKDWAKPYNWDRQKRTHPAGKANHPVVLVSWEDAQAFCKWANCRLPTEEEWEKAARGEDGRTYPWGNEEPDPSRANFNQNEKGTTPVGKYSPRGDSPYGCADMAGNVWKWTASKYDASNYVLRGGSWYYNASSLRVAARVVNGPSGRYYDVGFRCAFSL